MSDADDTLRRIEALIQGLDSLPDPAGRQLARGLLEVVLDLHGVALARIAFGLAAAPGGAELLSRLSEDPHICAVLLLHGLHPQELVDRVRNTLAALNSELAQHGVRLTCNVLDTGTARITVHHAGRVPSDLEQRIEAAVIDAAPELESLVIDGLDVPAEKAAPQLAG